MPAGELGGKSLLFSRRLLLRVSLDGARQARKRAWLLGGAWLVALAAVVSLRVCHGEKFVALRARWSGGGSFWTMARCWVCLAGMRDFAGLPPLPDLRSSPSAGLCPTPRWDLPRPTGVWPPDGQSGSITPHHLTSFGRSGGVLPSLRLILQCKMSDTPLFVWRVGGAVAVCWGCGWCRFAFATVRSLSPFGRGGRGAAVFGRWHDAGFASRACATLQVCRPCRIYDPALLRGSAPHPAGICPDPLGSGPQTASQGVLLPDTPLFVWRVGGAGASG